MLVLKSTPKEIYNDEENKFQFVPGVVLKLEHSLLSLSKWEAIHKKPFLSNGRDNKTREETLSYIKCMLINSNSDTKEAVDVLSLEELKRVSDYISDTRTATTFSDTTRSGGREIMTSEVIYYYMVAANIPFEAEKWHLNRLLVLLKVASIKSNPKQNRMSKKDAFTRNKLLNSQRRAAANSKG